MAYEVKRGDIKRFREYLNTTCAGTTYRNYRYHQKTRKYGDYLYHQDREKFFVDMIEWLSSDEKIKKQAMEGADLR